MSPCDSSVPSGVPDVTVTQLLVAVRHGETGAKDRLIELVYAELHRLARQKLAHERPDVTLQPTALVNEAWLRLFGGASNATSGEHGFFENRRHFFASAANAMHRICVDHARRRRAWKRGAGHRMETGTTASPGGSEPGVFDRDPLEVLALDEALTRLAKEDQELVEIVRLRYFVDLSLDDAAKVLGISRRTVAYRWRMARAWLHRALAGEG